MRFQTWPLLEKACSGFAAFATAILALTAVQAHAAIFVESWESPVIAPGTTSTSRPAPWTQFGGVSSQAVIIHPNSTSVFDDVEPLGSPAEGNQALRLAGLNTGVYRLSGDVILPNTIYTYSAAIGNDVQSAQRNDSWAIALWADTNNSGSFEGEGFDVFIGQQFGLTANAVNPAAGQWATNSFTFNSADTPTLVGKQFIAFLNNFLSDGASYYDNVTLEIQPPTPSPVPEPASLLVWSTLGLTGLALRRSRRKSRS